MSRVLAITRTGPKGVSIEPGQGKIKVLVIWCEIPDGTWFIHLELDKNQWKEVKDMHNYFINMEDQEGIGQKINNFFYDDQTQKFRYEKTTEMLIDVHYDYVIITGFIL